MGHQVPKLDPDGQLLLGDRQAMEKQAMLEAQQLIERAAGRTRTRRRRGAAWKECSPSSIGGVGWHVSVQWK